MQFIETALAFAVTMLVLSMVVSTFVELLHRLFAMREKGLKYMLGQMFDQVLTKYIAPTIKTKVDADDKITAALKNDTVQSMIKSARDGFVERMSANRSPVGIAPDPRLAVNAPKDAAKPAWQIGNIWGGRDLTTLTPAEFMERFGSDELGKTLNDAVKAGGADVAQAVEVVLKDIAQKFEAFGKEAGAYFEGRARFVSVMVAIVFAFAVHVDAIDLFQTFLRDPNVRAKVIEQTQAVTAQQKAAQDKLHAASKPTAPATGVAGQAPAAEAAGGAPASAGAKSDPEVEKLKEDLRKAIDDTKKTTTQLSDLGVPIGWKNKDTDTLNFLKELPVCTKKGMPDRAVPVSDKCGDGEERKTVGFGAVSLFFSLLLGGFLVGLGGPFWYDAVMGLTNIRSVAGKVTGANTQSQAAAAAAATASPADADKAQPVTPVGAFEVSSLTPAPKKKQE
jgi:hypothetical protein